MGVLQASDNEYIKSVHPPKNRRRKMKYEINDISLTFGGILLFLRTGINGKI